MRTLGLEVLVFDHETFDAFVGSGSPTGGAHPRSAQHVRAPGPLPDIEVHLGVVFGKDGELVGEGLVVCSDRGSGVPCPWFRGSREAWLSCRGENRLLHGCGSRSGGIGSS